MTSYEIYALRYASHIERRRSDNFIQRDPHDGPMPLDFFVWLLKSDKRTILVDTGFSASTAAMRQRNFLRCPIDSLSILGTDGPSIDDVIITHLHYDHAGNLKKLPRARFHIQDDELDYATGRCMCHPVMRHAYSVEDVVDLVRCVYTDRVVFHRGNDEIAPGVELLHIGGHTKGLQSVRVHTARGWVVLASDATHFYDNMRLKSPFPIVYNVADMLAGYETLAKHADSPDHIVPGHDPAVLRLYPRCGDDDGIVALHKSPRAA